MPGRIESFIKQFNELNNGDVPDFTKCKRTLDKALWVLWVAEEKLDDSKLTAKEIASIIVETQETTIDEKSVTNSLNRASDKVHRYYEKGGLYFKIMRIGKEHMSSIIKEGMIDALYFEPGSRFSSKRLLKGQIMEKMDGDLQILDPYCGERTLDILTGIKEKNIQLLTRLNNLRGKEKDKFLREIKDMKAEVHNIEIRDYPNSDIHDRYIISNSEVAIIGHSIKDFGSKETSAVVLNKEKNKDIFLSIKDNFVKKWEVSTAI